MYTFVRMSSLLFAGALVASCATSATNTLPQARRDALRIDAIDLSFAPNAGISWSDALDEFKRGGTPDTPDARRAFLEKKAAVRIRTALDAVVLPAFRGTDSARLKIVVRSVSVPPVVLRLLVGGNYTIKADIRVVDVKTGQTILDAPDFNGVIQGGAGPVQIALEQMFPDPIDRVSRAFASAVRGWLQTGQAFSTGFAPTRDPAPAGG